MATTDATAGGGQTIVEGPTDVVVMDAGGRIRIAGWGGFLLN